MEWLKRKPKPPKIERQLQEILNDLKRLEKRMSQEFDNLKVVVEDAVQTMLAAIAKIGEADSPAAIQAEADKLAEAVASLKEAINPTPPEPPAA